MRREIRRLQLLVPSVERLVQVGVVALQHTRATSSVPSEDVAARRCCGYDIVVHLRAEDVTEHEPPLSFWRHGGRVPVEVLENLRFAV